MTGALSPTHWAIILVVVLLLFGAKRLPDAARGLGKSMRIFKAETAALTENDEQRSSSGSVAPDDGSTDTPTGPGPHPSAAESDTTALTAAGRTDSSAPGAGAVTPEPTSTTAA